MSESRNGMTSSNDRQPPLLLSRLLQGVEARAEAREGEGVGVGPGQGQEGVEVAEASFNLHRSVSFRWRTSSLVCRWVAVVRACVGGRLCCRVYC